MAKQANLQRGIAVNWNGDTGRIPGLRINMMTAGYSLELPTVLFKHTREVFSGN